MIDMIERFLESDGNPTVGRVLLLALDDGGHHTLNFNVFDVTIDPSNGQAVFEDVLGPGLSTAISVDELRRLAVMLVDQGREDP